VPAVVILGVNLGDDVLNLFPRPPSRALYGPFCRRQEQSIGKVDLAPLPSLESAAATTSLPRLEPGQKRSLEDRCTDPDYCNGCYRRYGFAVVFCTICLQSLCSYCYREAPAHRFLLLALAVPIQSAAQRKRRAILIQKI